MVNIDDVYQKVLVLANKEQRGYITPQEFNLLADKAQLDIITQYFHDIKIGNARPMNSSESSDFLEMTKERLDFLRHHMTITSWQVTNTDKSAIYPTQNTDVVGSDILDIANISVISNNVEVTRVNSHELKRYLQHPLSYPTLSRPIYMHASSWFTNNTNTHNLHIDIFPQFDENTEFRLEYWRKPKTPNWGYVIVNKKPLYNFNITKHFELHPAEEERLVMRILQLAGITLEDPALQQSSMVDAQTTKQNQG